MEGDRDFIRICRLISILVLWQPRSRRVEPAENEFLASLEAKTKTAQSVLPHDGEPPEVLRTSCRSTARSWAPARWSGASRNWST